MSAKPLHTWVNGPLTWPTVRAGHSNITATWLKLFKSQLTFMTARNDVQIFMKWILRIIAGMAPIMKMKYNDKQTSFCPFTSKHRKTTKHTNCISCVHKP